MNRLMECKPYRIREELEDVLRPWPIKEDTTRTLSDLEVNLQGKYVPHAEPTVISEEVQLEYYNRAPVQTTRLLERSLKDEKPELRKNEAIEEGMKVFDEGGITIRGKSFYEKSEMEDEPDASYAMLESENEARYRFEGFLKRMRIHYSEYIPTGIEDEAKYEPPKYELPPMKRDKKPPAPYYDKRCDDTRKMIPMVYEAPPYPQYWLLKKKPKDSLEKQPEQED